MDSFLGAVEKIYMPEQSNNYLYIYPCVKGVAYWIPRNSYYKSGKLGTYSQGNLYQLLPARCEMELELELRCPSFAFFWNGPLPLLTFTMSKIRSAQQQRKKVLFWRIFCLPRYFNYYLRKQLFKMYFNRLKTSILYYNVNKIYTYKNIVFLMS